MNELEIIERIRKLRGARGIGDDCAIFRPPAGEDLLLKTDQLIEDVHFRRSMGAAKIGERALARSLSDIAAMGGRPRLCLVSLATPFGSRWIDTFFAGLMRLARKTGTTLAGGDLARSASIYCDVMVCGSVRRGAALRRGGARPGDALYVSGRLGKAWDRRIEPRLSLGQSLVGRATACMDISDGLSIDLYRLCKESGVAAELDRVPIARGSTLERALNGGEDYELLFTMPAGARPPRGTTRIGSILRGEPGVIRFRGKTLKPRGYDHFRSRLKSG
jgi:thiamine-monophosphate kinase